MAFTGRDDIIAELSGGKRDLWNFMKTAPAAAQAAGVWQTLWLGVGNPGAGAAPAATPGTVYSTDQATPTAGAMFFPDRSPDQRLALTFGAVATQNCTLMIYDRLAAVSGIALNAVGAKTVNSGALNRYAGALATNNEVWLEVTTATTTTAPVVALNQYTSADGTAAQSGGNVSFPAAATVLHSMIRLPMSATKPGVRSVEVGLNVVTAAAAGAANLVILQSLACLPLIANQWNQVSLLDDFLSIPEVLDNATIGVALLASTTTATTVWGDLFCAYG